MDKELKTQVAAVVEDLFNEKEEAEIRKRTEAELQRAAEAVSDLTSSLEEKNTEVAEYEEKLSDAEARIAELETELEAARKEVETANTKLGETEKALEDMKKDRAAEARMAELEDAGVARSDRDSQVTKVREMTDEDFASYKDELVSIREAVVAELEKARKNAEADAKAEEEAAIKAAEEAKKMMKKEEEMEDEEDPKMKKGKKKEKCSEDDTSGDSEEASGEKKTTVPAHITPGQAAMASLNMEYIPSEDLMSKYAKIGEAMAEEFKKKSN